MTWATLIPAGVVYIVVFVAEWHRRARCRWVWTAEAKVKTRPSFGAYLRDGATAWTWHRDDDRGDVVVFEFLAAIVWPVRGVRWLLLAAGRSIAAVITADWRPRGWRS